MAAPCAAFRIRGTTAAVVPAGADGVRLDLAVDTAIPKVAPSQFFMLRRSDGGGVLLARPFSVYLDRTGESGRTLSFLLKVMGPGTRGLSELKVGMSVDLVGPLGHGFPAVAPGERLSCVAGGVGIATFPLVFEAALAAGARAQDLTLCFGAARKDFLYEVDRYREYGIRVRVATDDGSAGQRGTALDLLREDCKDATLRPHKVFACGPERMLEAVVRFAAEEKLDAYLSLETRMGCGTGVCNACAVPVKPASNGGWPVAKACREGPVFRACDLTLEEAHQL